MFLDVTVWYPPPLFSFLFPDLDSLDNHKQHFQGVFFYMSLFSPIFNRLKFSTFQKISVNFFLPFFPCFRITLVVRSFLSLTVKTLPVIERSIDNSYEFSASL